MPVCQFLTNVPTKAIPDNFEVKLSQVIADVLSKPLERITVTLQPEHRMVRAGNNNPTCLLHVWAIAVFDAERNPQYAKKLCPFIAENLGIAEDRVVILFHDLKAEQVAKVQ